MSEEEYKLTTEDQGKLEKSRILSDAELLQAGAEYKIDESGKPRLEITTKQLEYLKHRDIGETARLELKYVDYPNGKVRRIVGDVKIEGDYFTLELVENVENNSEPEYSGRIQGDNFFVKYVEGDEAKEFFDLYINFIKKEPTKEELRQKITDKLLGK